MKNYLITGGCGFIGQHLAKALSDKKFYVDIIDLPNQIRKKNKLNSKYIKYYNCDVAKPKSLNKFKKKYVCAFHLAAQTSSRLSEKNPLTDIETNIIGSNNFCTWARKFKPRRIVFTSSMSVYGRIANFVSESEKCNPISIYGMSKYYCEKIFERLKNEGFKVTIFRLFNIYGPGQDLKNLNQGMFSIYMAQAIKNRKINVTGSLNRYRDFVYISDTVNALLKNPKKKNWILNLGTGKKTKVKKVINLIKNISQINNLKVVKKKSFHEDSWGSYANNAKLRSEGWKPKINLKLGAKLTINHVVKNKFF